MSYYADLGGREVLVERRTKRTITDLRRHNDK